jgi:hypothetical protein
MADCATVRLDHDRRLRRAGQLPRRHTQLHPPVRRRGNHLQPLGRGQLRWQEPGCDRALPLPRWRAPPLCPRSPARGHGPGQQPGPVSPQPGLGGVGPLRHDDRRFSAQPAVAAPVAAAHLPAPCPERSRRARRAPGVSHLPATVRGHRAASKQKTGRLGNAIHHLNLGLKSAIIGEIARMEGKCQARATGRFFSVDWR